jgi:hypothetical protein
MTIKSAPRRVSKPPTEVAMRQPRAVVSNSAIACRKTGKQGAPVLPLRPGG